VIFKGRASETLRSLHRDGVRYLEVPLPRRTEASSLLGICPFGRDEGRKTLSISLASWFEHVTYDVVDVFEVSEMQGREEFDSPGDFGDIAVEMN
jgi:hypothetical protein